MILPNPDLAIIDEDKLAGYSLNLEHSEGKHKARVFKSVLNIDASDAEELSQALLEALKNYDAIPSKSNAYGQKYIIDFPLSREGKSATIRSVWIIRNGENFVVAAGVYSLNQPNHGNKGITKNAPMIATADIPQTGTLVLISNAALTYTLANGSDGQSLTLVSTVAKSLMVSGLLVTFINGSSLTLVFTGGRWCITSAFNCTIT